ncbi:hypothetical protein Golob_020136, partial [Gossypium lobatum]|nr:hypothetical protein [Gossypium lobatum]
EATLNPINLQTETKAFYKKLWNLQIPPKIKFTIWGISWNYIPTFVNLKIKRVVADARCPLCNQEEEDTFDHQLARSASGLVVRNVGGEILASKSVIHTSIATPFAAEAHAGLQALKLGISMGFNDLQIIGDSRTIRKYMGSFGCSKSTKKREKAITWLEMFLIPSDEHWRGSAQDI